MSIFIVAEIGINHNGDMCICKELISSAKDAGCDAVKFQKRDIEKVYTQEYLSGPRESPWGNTQRAQKEGLEFGKDEYNEIANFCATKDIEWFASAWDLSSQQFLRQFNCNYNKIASAMIVHEELLRTDDGIVIAVADNRDQDVQHLCMHIAQQHMFFVSSARCCRKFSRVHVV